MWQSQRIPNEIQTQACGEKHHVLQKVQKEVMALGRNAVNIVHVHACDQPTFKSKTWPSVKVCKSHFVFLFPLHCLSCSCSQIICLLFKSAGLERISRVNEWNIYTVLPLPKLGDHCRREGEKCLRARGVKTSTRKQPGLSRAAAHMDSQWLW